MPWRDALKQIGGQFGSSVLCYFLFLKTLLGLNLLLLPLLLGLLVGVQAAFPPPPAATSTFTGLELLTGGVRAPRGRPGLPPPTTASPHKPRAGGSSPSPAAVASCLGQAKAGRGAGP